jgi:hypothetical protein
MRAGDQADVFGAVMLLVFAAFVVSLVAVF